MVRVFAGLALSNGLLFLGTAVAGLLRLGGSADRHVLLAVITLIFTCFLQVLTFTYFTVTGKMIGQMVHLAGLDPEPLVAVRRTKKAMTRQLGVVMAGVVLVAATGGALWRGGSSSLWHVAAGALTILVYLVVAYRQFNLIVLNTRLVDRVARTYRIQKQRHNGCGVDDKVLPASAPAS